MDLYGRCSVERGRAEREDREQRVQLRRVQAREIYKRYGRNLVQATRRELDRALEQERRRAGAAQAVADLAAAQTEDENRVLAVGEAHRQADKEQLMCDMNSAHTAPLIDHQRERAEQRHRRALTQLHKNHYREQEAGKLRVAHRCQAVEAAISRSRVLRERKALLVIQEARVRDMERELLSDSQSDTTPGEVQKSPPKTMPGDAPMKTRPIAEERMTSLQASSSRPIKKGRSSDLVMANYARDNTDRLVKREKARKSDSNAHVMASWERRREALLEEVQAMRQERGEVRAKERYDVAWQRDAQVRDTARVSEDVAAIERKVRAELAKVRAKRVTEENRLASLKRLGKKNLLMDDKPGDDNCVNTRASHSPIAGKVVANNERETHRVGRSEVVERENLARETRSNSPSPVKSVRFGSEEVARLGTASYVTPASNTLPLHDRDGSISLPVAPHKPDNATLLRSTTPLPPPLLLPDTPTTTSSPSIELSSARINEELSQKLHNARLYREQLEGEVERLRMEEERVSALSDQYSSRLVQLMAQSPLLAPLRPMAMDEIESERPITGRPLTTTDQSQTTITPQTSESEADMGSAIAQEVIDSMDARQLRKALLEASFANESTSTPRPSSGNTSCVSIQGTTTVSSLERASGVSTVTSVDTRTTITSLEITSLEGSLTGSDLWGRKVELEERMRDILMQKERILSELQRQLLMEMGANATTGLQEIPQLFDPSNSRGLEISSHLKHEFAALLRESNPSEYNDSSVESTTRPGYSVSENCKYFETVKETAPSDVETLSTTASTEAGYVRRDELSTIEEVDTLLEYSRNISGVAVLTPNDNHLLHDDVDAGVEAVSRSHSNGSDVVPHGASAIVREVLGGSGYGSSTGGSMSRAGSHTSLVMDDVERRYQQLLLSSCTPRDAPSTPHRTDTTATGTGTAATSLEDLDGPGINDEPPIQLTLHPPNEPPNTAFQHATSSTRPSKKVGRVSESGFNKKLSAWKKTKRQLL